jgi:hypothetical protein
MGMEIRNSVPHSQHQRFDALHYRVLKAHNNRIIIASNDPDLPEKNIKNGHHGMKYTGKIHLKNPV